MGSRLYADVIANLPLVLQAMNRAFYEDVALHAQGLDVALRCFGHLVQSLAKRYHKLFAVKSHVLGLLTASRNRAVVLSHI